MLPQLAIAAFAGIAWLALKNRAETEDSAPPPAAKKDRFYEDVHRQCRADLSQGELELSQKEQEAERLFTHTSLALGSSAVCALVYPSLLLLHIPALFYVSIPRYREARQDLLEKREISVNVVSTLSSLGSLAYALAYPPMLVVYATSVWLYAVTNKLVIRTQDHTRQNLANLFGEQPRKVWVLREGVELETAFESVVAGDILVLDAGQMIPIDGIIHEGTASIDEHMLTGESRPVEKSVGETVFAATLVLAGRVYVRIEKTGQETVAAQIADMLKGTDSYTASLQLRGQEIADRYAETTLWLGALALPVSGAGGSLAVLGSGIGNSMRILGPVSVLSYLQLSARRGILIKDGRALELVRSIDTVIFDKTGTLTLQQPQVGGIHPCAGHGEETLLAYAAAAEQRQIHPIAKAILQAAQQRRLEIPPVSEAAYEVGYGVKVSIGGQWVRVGSRRFMDLEKVAIPPTIDAVADQVQGHTLIYVAIGDGLGGVIEMRPTVRPEARRVIAGLRQAGLDIHILSGDHEKPTRVLAEQLGVAHYAAETLPEHKADYVTRLQRQGKFVCFVGDGINDSLALKKAQVSVSISGASNIATDTAQIILMEQNLGRLNELFRIAEAFEANLGRDLLSSAIPGAVIIGGAFVGAVGFASSVGLYWLGAMAGLANAASPLLAGPEDAQ